MRNGYYNLFQSDHPTMTSSRRHFVISLHHSFLHNHSSYDFYFSFWWRHHSQIFDYRRQCIIYHICVLCLWEVTFFQTWICMAMISEPYLSCYSSIFSPNIVCCSWDYGLSEKWSPVFNQMSGTWSNFQFVLWKHITLICQHDKLPLVSDFPYGISPIVSVRIFISPTNSVEILSRYLKKNPIMFKFSQYLCHDQE